MRSRAWVISAEGTRLHGSCLREVPLIFFPPNVNPPFIIYRGGDGRLDL